MISYYSLVRGFNAHFLTLGDGVFDKMNNQETIDIAWDAARKCYRSQGGTNQSIHAICGQGIELVLKASVASRTLDNITGVLISFKNFRKTLKNESANGVAPANLQQKGGDAYRPHHLNAVLSLPNGDLTSEDIEKPDNISKSEISVDPGSMQFKSGYASQ